MAEQKPPESNQLPAMNTAAKSPEGITLPSIASTLGAQPATARNYPMSMSSLLSDNPVQGPPYPPIEGRPGVKGKGWSYEPLFPEDRLSASFQPAARPKESHSLSPISSHHPPPDLKRPASHTSTASHAKSHASSGPPAASPDTLPKSVPFEFVRKADSHHPPSQHAGDAATSRLDKSQVPTYRGRISPTAAPTFSSSSHANQTNGNTSGTLSRSQPAPIAKDHTDAKNRMNVYASRLPDHGKPATTSPSMPGYFVNDPQRESEINHSTHLHSASEPATSAQIYSTRRFDEDPHHHPTPSSSHGHSSSADLKRKRNPMDEGASNQSQHRHRHVHHVHGPITKTATEQPTFVSTLPANTTSKKADKPLFTDEELLANSRDPFPNATSKSVEGVLNRADVLAGKSSLLGAFQWNPEIDTSKLLDAQLLRQNIGGKLQILVDQRWFGGIPFSMASEPDIIYYTAVAKQHPWTIWDAPAFSDRRIWGTKIYTDDSDPLAAAVHSGCLHLHPFSEKPMTATDKSLQISVRILPQLVNYQGMLRSNIESRSWGNSHDGVSLYIESVQLVQTKSPRRRTKRPIARHKNRSIDEDAMLQIAFASKLRLKYSIAVALALQTSLMNIEEDASRCELHKLLQGYILTLNGELESSTLEAVNTDEFHVISKNLNQILHSSDLAWSSKGLQVTINGSTTSFLPVSNITVAMPN